MRQMWRRYGPYIIGAAVAVVLVVAANEGWAWWQQSNAARSSDQFYAALDLADGGDAVAAQEALNGVIASGSGGYPTLARFKQAGLLAKEGKSAEALAAYDALSTTEPNPRLRELALVLAANILVDTGTLSDVNDRVSTIASPDNPLRNAAREAIGLAQYKAGELSAASVTFQSILDDPFTTGEMQQRIQIYMAQLVAEGAVVDEPAVEDAAAADPAAEAVEPAADTAEPAADATADPAATDATAAPAEGETPAN
jgi:hypothetical protein